jgi:hypothetical protein
MKTIIKLVIAALLFAVDLSAGNSVTKPRVKDPYHLEIAGEFVAQRNINYTVFKYNKDSETFVKEERGKARKYFHFTCNRGCKYIIRFQDKSGNVKFLMVDATREGYFEVDVDFRKSYDAQIKYTKNGYSLVVLTSSGVKPDLAQK